jgi:hypothetical protein
MKETQNVERIFVSSWYDQWQEAQGDSTKYEPCCVLVCPAVTFL